MATSRYDSSVKVKQEVIDRIKKMGMGEAVKAANSGSESAEFVEGAKRMYGSRVGASNAANLKKRQNEAAANPLARRAPSADMGGGGGGESKSVPMPKSAPAAAKRKTETSSKPKSEMSSAEKALGQSNAAFVNRNVSTPLSKVSANLAGSRAVSMEGAKKKAGSWWKKNVGRPLSRAFNA